MDIKDINIRNLQMENARLRNLLADRDARAKSIELEREEWSKEARVGYISLEEHFSEIESLRKENSQENSRLQKELDDTKSRLSVAESRIKELEDCAAESEEAHKEELAKFNEVQEMADKAKANEIDMMSIVKVIQNRLFNHNSDRMRFLNSQLDIDDETVREQGFEAILQAISQDADKELNANGDSADNTQGGGNTEKSDKGPKVKLPTSKKKDKKDKKPRGRYTFSAEVLKSFGVDTSNLPEGAKAIVRKGKKDKWTIQLFYYSPAKVYTKVYEIGRFNVPGRDPMNSKRPQAIVESNPLMPSFCRFYFESKFAYNLSEENVLRMLESMKCHFPQSTLNKYIHQIMDYLRVRLESLMLEVIRTCGFVQNDETRILVRSRKNKEDDFKYNTEYIHAALSLEKKLVVMLYKEGSRSHEIPEEKIFRGSLIECFTADRAPLYVALEKDLEEYYLQRQACWQHARHYLVDAFVSDHRVLVLIQLINALFLIEREAKARNYTPERRHRFRLEYSASIVGKIMSLLKKIRAEKDKYGALVMRAVNYILDDEDAFKK
ncbi:MAG: transposase, partial [Bacteroidales bacterium]|nr:transposase [Bacteroidales bacterium]